MSAWGKADNKSVSGTVTLTAPAITFNGATGHAAEYILLPHIHSNWVILLHMQTVEEPLL